MSNRKLPRLLQTPAVVLLLLWMLIPLGMTLYFSFIRYVLNSLRRPEWTTPSLSNWRGFGNYEYVISPFFVMPAVNAVLWINMILDPVLGLNGIAVSALNETVAGLRDFPVLGAFFSLWPVTFSKSDLAAPRATDCHRGDDPVDLSPLALRRNRNRQPRQRQQEPAVPDR